MLLKKELILMIKDLDKIKYYMLIICAKFVYSLTSIFSKLASIEVFLSRNFCIYYIVIILMLGIYALIWQQALKHVDLSIAMLFKPISLILIVLWAYMFFGETISLKMMVGMIFILVGIVVVGENNE